LNLYGFVGNRSCSKVDRLGLLSPEVINNPDWIRERQNAERPPTPAEIADAIEVPFESNFKPYILVDTSGLLRRGKVFEAFE
jgi:hypothetical protein